MNPEDAVKAVPKLHVDNRIIETMTAIPMTSSSRDIYFHTSSGNQTKL